MKPWLWLAFGIVVCSTAVILIKATHTPPVWLAAQRLLLASAILAPLALRAARQGARPDAPDAGRGQALGLFRVALVPGLFLAAHFATWAAGARLIPAANSTLIANFIPVVMPVVALVLLRERASLLELVATAIGVGGVAVLAAGDLSAAGAMLRGDGLCVVAMLALAVYLALSRRRPVGSLWLYVAPLYAIAGTACVPVALVLEGPPPLPTAHEALLVLALAAGPTVIGHTLMNRAMGELRPQAVSVALLGNVPSAALMAWALWGEVPTPAFWVTGAACVVAIGLVVSPVFLRQGRRVGGAAAAQ